MAFKQDSNLTGLRYAEEASLKTLPGSPIWYALEPNSYSDFGGQLATVARNPLNPSRQRKKGTITDLDASGGFNQDLTMNNLTRIMQGFFFSNAREKATNLPLNGTQVLCTSVTAATDKYGFGADPGAFVANDLLYITGFTNTANNGLKVCVSTDADDVTVADGTVEEAAPPATAKIQTVGRRLGSGTSAIAMNGNLVRLTDSATNMTTLGIIAGEWVYLGSDTSSARFADNQGWARVGSLAAGYLEFDKVNWTPTAEAGTAKTIDIYTGLLLKNEPVAADIIRRTYQIERTLGEDTVGTMSEYLVGAVANELSLNIPQADKVTMDLSFVALDNEQRDGATEVKAGDRPNSLNEEALNTTSDISRIQLGVIDSTDATVTPLFAFATEVTLTCNNNVSANKAIGTLGGFDTTAGTFEVGGSLTVYFADVAAVQAVRNNSDVTMDVIISKANKAIVIDVPLLSLGDGRLNVEQDQAITLPLETNAAESSFGHTLQMQFFPYLPNLAG
jgi:hypothetical protein